MAPPEIRDARPVLLVRDIDAATIDYDPYDAPHGFREFGTQDPTATTSPSGSALADRARGGAGCAPLLGRRST